MGGGGDCHGAGLVANACVVLTEHLLLIYDWVDKSDLAEIYRSSDSCLPLAIFEEGGKYSLDDISKRYRSHVQRGAG